MRIALAQMRNSGDMRENLEKSIEMIREAADHHADLVLFPEVQLTEFFPQYALQTRLLQKISLWLEMYLSV